MGERRAAERGLHEPPGKGKGRGEEGGRGARAFRTHRLPVALLEDLAGRLAGQDAGAAERGGLRGERGRVRALRRSRAGSGREGGRSPCSPCRSAPGSSWATGSSRATGGAGRGGRRAGRGRTAWRQAGERHRTAGARRPRAAPLYPLRTWRQNVRLTTHGPHRPLRRAPPRSHWLARRPGPRLPLWRRRRQREGKSSPLLWRRAERRKRRESGEAPPLAEAPPPGVARPGAEFDVRGHSGAAQREGGKQNAAGIACSMRGFLQRDAKPRVPRSHYTCF